MLDNCPIPNARGFAAPEGTGSNGVLILAEALGDAEVIDSLPLRPSAPAGSIAERALRMAGFTRSEFVLYNAVNTHPPNNYLEGADYEDAAIAWGRPLVEKVIRDYNVKCILALGNVALKAVTGLSGEYLSISYLRGYLLESVFGIPVIGSYHPSFLRRGGKKKKGSDEKIGGMNLLGILMRDLQQAVQVAKHGCCPEVPVPESTEYFLYPEGPTSSDFFEQVRHASFIAYDIETPRSGKVSEEDSDELGEEPILSIQFSAGRGTGIYLPWEDPYIEMARGILDLPVPKVGCNNWRFDDPRLASHGCPVRGPVHDLRWMWKHLQPDLPAGLQFIASFFEWPWPWKHLHATHPRWYGVVDVDVCQQIFPLLAEQLRSRGLFDSYQRYVIQMESVLKQAGERGIRIATEKYDGVREQLIEELREKEALMDHLVPDEAKSLVVRKKKPSYYKPFKPSNVSLVRYMRVKGHPVPMHFKRGTPTSEERELHRLAAKTKDPLYSLVLEAREISTLVNNHIKSWLPGPDGRVHPSFYGTSTGQLAARRPNSMNAPNHKELQRKLFRQLVVASPGHTLIEFDYKAFHVQTLAWVAEDADLMRVAKIDPHSFVTAAFLKLSKPEKLLAMPDGELAEVLAHVKKAHKDVRNAKVKHAFLGYNNGMGPRKLWNLYQEFFSTYGEGARLLKLLDDLFPRARQYRRRIVEQAADRHYLMSPFGCWRWFWEVFRARGVPGDDHEAALSYLTQNIAHCYFKEALLRLDATGWCKRAGFINPIHDALLFDCPNAVLDEARVVIKWEMERPSPVLVNKVAPCGLSVEIEIKEGPSWDAMKEVPCTLTA